MAIEHLKDGVYVVRNAHPFLLLSGEWAPSVMLMSHVLQHSLPAFRCDVSVVKIIKTDEKNRKITLVSLSTLAQFGVCW